MIENSGKIKAIIFDLDDTLYDCSGTLVVQGRKKVAKTIARLINSSEEEAYLLQLQMEEKYGVKANIYEKIVTHYHLPNSCARELLEEFVHVEISNIILFPDVIGTLMHLKSQGYKLILVTSGDKQIQEKKIGALGLNDNYFDDILIADRNKDQAKTGCFKHIMQQYNLKPEEIICVGDKIDDELTAGKTLGIVTVMFEHGRHYNAYLKVRDKYIKPDYFIKHINDILELRILNNSQVNQF
ncbi:MAG: HAD-IA family hydrolase [Candidatus Brocadiales bacterium]|nr:HAD-IA family hydrolase [Candidatus Brocadiales bacterium]